MSQGLDRFLVAAGEEVFRGGIADNCQNFQFIGKGYESMPAEQDSRFQIESARQVAGPMNALTDDAVRFVHVIGAIQVLKSIVGDAWVIFCMEHIRRNMLVLFEDDGKADLYCAIRLMDTLKSHPKISKLLAESTKGSRHNVTGTWIKTLQNVLLVAGLNDGNVSSLSWPLIWISEAWQHKGDGLLWKAFKRADRFPDDCKILNESQASAVGTDLHRATMAAHQVPLVWKCSACDGEQTWEWKHWNFHRPEDFLPRPQKSAQQEFPKPGTYGGMKWVDDDNGRRGIEERARSAWWECIWCGHRIHDSRQNRQSLMDSYVQDYKLARGLIPRQVCFTLPFEAARDNRFESTVANFLIAKEAKRLGNEVPMQDWFIAERAMFYEPNILRGTAPVITGSYDVKEKILDEVCRVMFVDCQQDDSLTATTGKSTMGKFWWVARAIDKNGNMFQLSRGWGGLEDWQAEQKRLEISNENLGIDGGFWRNDVIDLAARFIAPYERRIRKHGRWRAETIWHTYTVLVGDGKRTSWKWQDGHSRSISPMQPQSRRVTLKDQTAEIKIPLYQWSNLGIKDQLDNLISGKSEVQFKSLSRNQLPESVQIRETGNLTYENQMSAEFRTQKKTGQPYWEKSRPDNHYFDCEAGCLALFGLGGFLGVAAAPETEANSET